MICQRCKSYKEGSEHNRRRNKVEAMQGSWLTGMLLRKHTQKNKVHSTQCVTGAFPEQIISFIWKLEETMSNKVSEQNIFKQINKINKNNCQNQTTTMSETKCYLHSISEGTQIGDDQILAEICNILLNSPKE